MPIYEMTAGAIRPIDQTTFDAVGVRERDDLQRLLRAQIEVIASDTLIIAEEFCDWEDSRCRIDLLGVDKDANLVVFELKRTEDGGHMELQAVRYAAMVSAMTFEKAVEAYAALLSNRGQETDARTGLLQFLDWEEPDEDRFAQEVRIVLVSAEFSKELTTAVMWLNDQGLDLRCIRLKPYRDNGRVLIDVQQVIPLPEAADYQVRIREKEARERFARRGSDIERLCCRFWVGLLQRAKQKTDLHARISARPSTWIAASSGVGGLTLVYVFSRDLPRVELYIDTVDAARNKAIFDTLHAARAAIEDHFGGPLGWERLGNKRASRVRCDIGEGSIRDEAQWPALQDRMVDLMVRFERAIRPHLDALE